MAFKDVNRACVIAVTLAMAVAIGAAGLASGETVLPLDGKAWTMTNVNESISLNTTLPAYALEVLRAAGVIGDPLYRCAVGLLLSTTMQCTDLPRRRYGPAARRILRELIPYAPISLAGMLHLVCGLRCPVPCQQLLHPPACLCHLETPPHMATSPVRSSQIW